jgi:hypothetical protein
MNSYDFENDNQECFPNSYLLQEAVDRYPADPAGYRGSEYTPGLVSVPEWFEAG